MANKQKGQLPEDVNAYLTDRYYDIDRPAAFTSVHKLYDTIKKEGVYDIPLELIREWGMTQDAITLNKRPIYKGKARRKVITGMIDSLWDVDLLQLNQERFAKANDGYSYIICCVDILSRVGWLSPIKSKGGQDVVKGFEALFKRTDRRPLSMRGDRGKEWRNKYVADFMKRHKINLYFTNSDTKANFSEIFIKQIKRRLFRIFQHRVSYRYIDILPNVERSYNETIHSSLKMSPLEVTPENQEQVWFKQYFPPQDYKKAFRHALQVQRRRKGTRPSDPFKYKVGDSVRISYLKEPFTRDYDERFSGEVFTIATRKIHQGIPVYYLTDYSNDPVEGGLYEWELQKIKFNPDQPFKIDKVLKTRKRGKVKESLVRFLHWPAKYNQWIPSANIETLPSQ